MTNGFETKDGYAVVPWGKKFVIVYGGQQLADVKNTKEANKFIKEHRNQPKLGTVFIE